MVRGGRLLAMAAVTFVLCPESKTDTRMSALLLS